MHYNPISVRQSAATVRSFAEKDQLAAVCIESCVERWEKTCRNQPRGSIVAKFILPNEMQSAQFAADDFQTPVFLCDQNFSVTTQRMKETLRESFSDFTSLNFRRLAQDLEDLGQTVVSPGDSSSRLGLKDFLNPRVLVLSPVSLLRYPLAILLKSPVLGASFLFVGFALAGSVDNWLNIGSDPQAVSMDPLNPIIDVFGTVATIVVETTLLARTFVVALLAERNAVLSQNIRSACRLSPSSDRDKVVVAVLGAAHINGVAALLEQ